MDTPAVYLIVQGLAFTRQGPSSPILLIVSRSDSVAASVADECEGQATLAPFWTAKPWPVGWLGYPSATLTVRGQHCSMTSSLLNRLIGYWSLTTVASLGHATSFIPAFGEGKAWAGLGFPRDWGKGGWWCEKWDLQHQVGQISLRIRDGLWHTERTAQTTSPLPFTLFIGIYYSPLQASLAGNPSA